MECVRPRTKKRRKPRPKRVSKAISGRERERRKGVTDVYVKNHFLNTPSPIPEPCEDFRLVMYEKMIDTSGFLQNWGNPVSHVKYKEQRLARPSAVHSSSCIVGADTARRPDCLSMLQTGLPALDSALIFRLAAEAEEHFRNAVNPEVLFLNFLLELLTLVKGIIEKAQEGIKLIETMRQRFTRYYRLLIQQGKSESDALFLAWSFAIKPFIGDVKKLWCAIEKARKRTKWLYQHSGRPVRVHFKRDISDESGLKDHLMISGVDGFWVDGWNPSCPPWVPMCIQPRMDPAVAQYELRPEFVQLVFCAQATVVYTLPPFRFDAEGGGFALVFSSLLSTDRLGSFVWEAIPFSFIVDWFTDIGKDLAALIDGATKNFPDGEILETCHSFKLTSAWSVWYKPTEFSCIHAEESLGLVTWKRYQRQSGLPFSPDFHFNMSGLGGGYHLSLEAALISQKLKRFRKRRRPIRGW